MRQGNGVAREVWRGKWSAKEYAEPEPNAVQRIRDFIRITYIDKRWYDSKQNMDSNTRMDNNSHHIVTHQSNTKNSQNFSNNHNNVSNNENNSRANPPASVNVCSLVSIYIINMLYDILYILYYNIYLI